MALAGRVFYQQHLAGADEAAFAVARGDANAVIEIDDVLPARGGMPVQIVLGLRFPENDPGGGQAFGELAAPSLLDPLDFDIPKMRLAFLVGVQVVNAHVFSLSFVMN